VRFVPKATPPNRPRSSRPPRNRATGPKRQPQAPLEAKRQTEVGPKRQPAPAAHPEPSGWRPPPSLVILVPFALAIGANYLHPWPMANESLKRLGVPLIFVSLAGMYWATREMNRYGTTKVAWRTGAALVTSGPFAWSRNPAYLAFFLWCVGAALLFDTWWPIAILPAVFAAFHPLVIRPEEAYLGQRFGAEYDAYRARVRRWI
jgi:protein-S-isoprenylcysteine O-methyltransferase Ste14